MQEDDDGPDIIIARMKDNRWKLFQASVTLNHLNLKGCETEVEVLGSWHSIVILPSCRIKKKLFHVSESTLFGVGGVAIVV